MREFDEQVVERVRAFLDDLGANDAALVDQARDAEYSATTAAKVSELYKARVSDRMSAIGASMLLGNDAKAERIAGSSKYEWDGSAVMRIIDGALGEDSWPEYVEAVLVPEHIEYKVNTTKVKALAKKMGPQFEEALMAAANVTQGASRIAYADRKPATGASNG